MKKVAKVIEILNVYSSLGYQGVKIYFDNPELEIIENSWVFKIKNLIDKNMWISASMEIELLITKFKNYEEYDENKYNEES